jgi:hypothetical protein
MYDETDDEETWLYKELLEDPIMRRVHWLVMDGQWFRHEKHPGEVHPGVQHKLFTWVCETIRPHTQCPCGLYTITWRMDEPPLTRPAP